MCFLVGRNQNGDSGKPCFNFECAIGAFGLIRGRRVGAGTDEPAQYERTAQVVTKDQDPGWMGEQG
jgi:hypothetical protein